MKIKIASFVLFISFLVKPAFYIADEIDFSGDLDTINEQMLEEDAQYKDQEEIKALQDEINQRKEEIEELNTKLIENQEKIEELEKKLPEYEKQAKNALVTGQKFYNSKGTLSLLENIFENDNVINYITNKNIISKLVGAIKEETLKLFDAIDELEAQKVSLQEDIDRVKEIEKELIEQLDVLKEEKKQAIVSQAYQVSYDFFNEECVEGQVYGVDCGPKLTETKKFKKPIKEGYVTNEFGGWDALNQDDGHTGIDITSDPGMEGYLDIYPAAPGQVVDVFVDSYGGIQVMMIHVKDGKNYITNYAHLSGVDVVPGDIIGVDDKIGTMGETGVATGVHLHFEIIQGPYYIHSELENPRNYVTFPFMYITFYEEEEDEE